MFFNIQTIHPNISVVTFTSKFKPSEWERYEQAYRELYRIHTRAVIVFDLRAVSMDISNIINFISLKKNLLLALKAKTCQMFLAAIIVTEYDFISDLVSNIAKLSGQASLFYSCNSIEDAGNIASRLVCIINRRPIIYAGGLKWKDISSGNICVLLMAFFLRHARHFIRAQRI